MSKAGWYVHFREPILTPKGNELITLRDAADYITKLPKAQHDAKVWQTAMNCLLQAADSGGPTDFARMGMMQALYPKGEPVYDLNRKDPRWGPAEGGEGPMSDEETVARAVLDIELILANYLHPGDRDPNKTIEEIIEMLDRHGVIAAAERVESGHGPRVVT